MKFRSEFCNRWTSAAVMATAILVTSACGTSGGQADAGVASLKDQAEDNGEKTNGGTTSDESGDRESDNTAMDAPENPEDAFALFSECMTDAGIDVGITLIGGDSAGGRIDLDSGSALDGPDPQQPSGLAEDFDSEAFDEANEACQGHLANIDGGFDLSPEQETALEDAQLEWSECMDNEGVEMPDFGGSGGGIIISDGSTGDIDPQSGTSPFEDIEFERFEEAAEICQSVYDQFDELDGLFENNQAGE